jgi:hypothetical protein
MTEIVTSKENEAVIRAILEDHLSDIDDDFEFDSIMDLAEYRRRVDSSMLVKIGLYADSGDAQSAIEALAKEDFLEWEGPPEFAYCTTLKIFQYASLMIPPIVRPEKLKEHNAIILKRKEEVELEHEEPASELFIDHHLFNFSQYGGSTGLIRYEWTSKLKDFNEILWRQQFKKPELKAELANLAFKSALYTSVIAMDLDDKRFHSPVVNEEDARYREKYFCEKFWNLIAFIATDRIPANSDEKKVLLRIVDGCARLCFRDDISREERTLRSSSRAIGNLWKKSTIEEIEAVHMAELLDGRKLPFGTINWLWEDLKPFIRKNDELWDYNTDQESWDHLAGESGVALVRDGEVIADIMVAIS